MEDKKIVETVAKLETKVEQHDDEIKEIKNITKLIYEISTDIKLLFQQGSIQNEKLDKVESRVDKLSNDMDEVKIQDDKKDAKKWNNSIKIIGTAILSAVIGVVLVKIGLI